MSGTKVGGIKAANANKRRNPEHYAEIGRIGGKAGKGDLKEFANPNHPFYGKSGVVGKVGGHTSRRGNAKSTVVRPRDEHGRFMSPAAINSDWGLRDPETVEAIEDMSGPKIEPYKAIPNVFYALWIIWTAFAIIIAFSLGLRVGIGSI